MFVPSSSSEALMLLLVSLLCWGSWGNSAKWSTLPFPAFYVVYSVGTCFWAGVIGLTLGSDLFHDAERRDFIANLREVGMGPPVGLACLSGVLSNVATILLTLLITLVGLATAFPVCVGTGLVVGTLLAYIVQPGETDLRLLCLGVGLAVGALTAMMGAHALKGGDAPAEGVAPESSTLPPLPALASARAKSHDDSAMGRVLSFGNLSTFGGSERSASRPVSAMVSREGSLLDPPCSRPVSTLSSREASLLDPPCDDGAASRPRLSVVSTLGLAVLSGAIMGGFPPLETMAQDGTSLGTRARGPPLTPYTCAFYFCTASMVSTWPICFCLARRPLFGAWPVVPSIVREIRRADWRARAMPVAGALVWTLGTTLNFVAGEAFCSQAVAYSIGQSAPMVAAAWGVLYFREFDAAPLRSWALLALMAICYGGAVATIALSSSRL